MARNPLKSAAVLRDKQQKTRNERDDRQTIWNAPFLLYCALGHDATQLIELVSTTKPGSHDTHELEPAVAEKVPAGQAAQTYALFTNCPASQLVSSSITRAETIVNAAHEMKIRDKCKTALMFQCMIAMIDHAFTQC